MQIDVYRKNRARFSAQELEGYRGQWVAFSADGCRIVASADDIETLNDLVCAAGEYAEQVAFERIILDDDWSGGIEFE